MRSTLADVAREAGVSTATADRVLNNRTGVRARTREIVFETARRLGYIADDPANAPALPVARLHFVFPAGTNTFIRMLRREVEVQALSRPDLDVRTEAIEGFVAEELAGALLNLRGKVDGVGVVALDHPLVREALRTLAASGIKIVTLVSDISQVPRAAYVGIDNRAAGRLAGYLVGRLWKGSGAGKVALFAGSRSYRGHEEREMGFRHILGESFSQLSLVATHEVQDDRERAYRETIAVLEAHPDLAAIYNIGGGTVGIGRALKESGRAGDVLFVAHEVTDGTRGLLLDGTLDAVIDQNPRVEAREALSVLSQAVRGQALDFHPPRLQVIFRENLPES